MSALNKFVSTPATQTEQSRPDQVKNNAGGFVFQVSEVSRLERFLILGTDGGTYYVGEKDLTKQNVDFVRKMIATSPESVLTAVIDVSVKGRAYRNDAAVFVLALLLAEGPDQIKAAVIDATPKVARTATHVYQLAAFIEGLGGWGRAKRKAVAKWFESKTADQLAYQAVKYRQRNGWTMRDLMRLAHPTGIDPRVGNFILGKEYMPEIEVMGSDILTGFNVMQSAKNIKEVLSFLNSFPNLPWETIPTQFLKDKDVWAKILTNDQLNGQALVRNVTRLAKIGAFDDMTFSRMYANKLVDSDMIAKTRLHPIQYLLASVTYADGQLRRHGSGGDYFSMWGSPREKSWVTNSVILDALDEGFHKSFKSITPANKRTMLALDVSGSMGGDANGIDLSCMQVSAAMAMVTARTEPMHQIMGFATQFQDLGISSRMTLTQVMDKISKAHMGSTDLAKPMLYAAEKQIEVDTFAIFTDNETWAGRVHPYEALKSYRQKMGIDAKLAVFGVSATEFSIADPKDTKGSMDFVGFDSNAASVFADFSAGRL